MPLEWVRAERKHIRLLERFTCADPPKAIYSGGRFTTHPRPWELVVQRIVRRVRPDKSDDEIWLGFSGEHVAVVLIYKVDGPGYYVDVVARDSQFRGEHFGREALDFLVATVKSEREVTISCHVHKDNKASNELMEQYGFLVVEPDKDHNLWAVIVAGDTPADDE